MDLYPRGDEACLPRRQTPAGDFDFVNRNNSNAALVVRMEMRPMMWSASLHEHPDYDAEEAADLRQLARTPLPELPLCRGQLVSELSNRPSVRRKSVLQARRVMVLVYNIDLTPIAISNRKRQIRAATKRRSRQRSSYRDRSRIAAMMYSGRSSSRKRRQTP